MTPQSATTSRIGIDEYLAGEKDGDIRHEYIGGEVYAMTGASDRHGLIVNALAFTLTPAARKRGCQLFTSDMKVHLRHAGVDVFYYPDLVVVCDLDDRAPYYREKPCLIVEVLSETTERIDRREKLFAYTGIPSLGEYLLVAQDKRYVEIHRRDDGDWNHTVVDQGSFRIDCLDINVAVDALYEDVEV